MELAHLNKFDYAFIDWLENANSFCNSLVDRIVPGKLNSAQKEEVNKLTGYADDLMIMSETYSLWAIETAQPAVKEILSFAGADDSVVITSDIHKYRELKLRLLNGTHTFSCGLAYLAGFETVKEAMEDKVMGLYIKELMANEIAPCVSDTALSPQEALEFSNQVIDRFRNPFIEHLWINITLNYTHKMRMRNVPLLIEHYNRFSTVPEYMAMGFAAFLIFMKSEPSESGKYYGEWNGALYPVQDEHAAYFNQLWSSDSLNEIVITALSNESLWGKDLNSLPEFSYAVANYLELFLQNKVIAAIKQYQLNRNKVKSHEA
jgi:tagaturonate reductase